MIALFFIIIVVLFFLLILNRNTESFNLDKNYLKELCPALKHLNPYYDEYKLVYNNNEIVIEQNNSIIDQYMYKINELKQLLKDKSTYELTKNLQDKENAEYIIEYNNNSKNQIDKLLI
jgi:hypothetical protein